MHRLPSSSSSSTTTTTSCLLARERNYLGLQSSVIRLAHHTAPVGVLSSLLPRRHPTPSASRIRRALVDTFVIAVVITPPPVSSSLPYRNDCAIGNKMAGGEHTFGRKTFHKPTYCHHCSDLLWGLIGQGYICEGAC